MLDSIFKSSNRLLLFNLKKRQGAFAHDVVVVRLRWSNFYFSFEI